LGILGSKGTFQRGSGKKEAIASRCGMGGRRSGKGARGKLLGCMPERSNRPYLLPKWKQISKGKKKKLQWNGQREKGQKVKEGHGREFERSAKGKGDAVPC